MQKIPKHTLRDLWDQDVFVQTWHEEPHRKIKPYLTTSWVLRRSGASELERDQHTTVIVYANIFVSTMLDIKGGTYHISVVVLPDGTRQL